VDEWIVGGQLVPVSGDDKCCLCTRAVNALTAPTQQHHGWLTSVLHRHHHHHHHQRHYHCQQQQQQRWRSRVRYQRRLNQFVRCSYVPACCCCFLYFMQCTWYLELVAILLFTHPRYVGAGISYGWACVCRYI